MIKAEWTNKDSLDLQPTCNQLATTEEDIISRQDAMAYPLSWEHYDKENGSRDFICGVESYRDYIEALPSADRPQGKWIVKQGSHEYIRTSWYVCDQCGGAGDISDKFCKHCGTRMRGE